MKIAPLADVKARLSAYLEECETEGPVITFWRTTENGSGRASGFIERYKNSIMNWPINWLKNSKASIRLKAKKV